MMDKERTRMLFRRRDMLAAQMVRLDAQLAEARRDWAKENGFAIPPRTEAFRRAVTQ